MQVVETLSQAVRTSNDDRAGARPGAAWVIDGATDLGPSMLGAAIGDAEWLAERMSAALQVVPLTHPERVLALALAEVRGELRIPCPPAGRGPTASIAVLIEQESELVLLNLGDCTTLLGTATGGVTNFGASRVRDLDALLVQRKLWQQRRGLSHAEAMLACGEIVAGHRLLANQAGGYWTLDLAGAALAQVEMLRLRRGEASLALLMSDGFYRLVDTYGRYQDAGLLAAARRPGGLAELYAELRDIERQDPECLRHPRFKAQDDATAVLIAL